MCRWSLFTACVVAEVRTSANFGVAVVVLTVMVVPGAAIVGTDVIAGRALSVPSEFKRYGGVKIRPSR